ncbi:shikimate kinase [Candidatus Vidania fulgoroideorum]
MQFLGLSGIGKTTFSIIECCFKNIYLIDSDLLYEKIYKTPITTLIHKYREQLFRKTENTINMLTINSTHLSTLGGGSIKNYLLIKTLCNYKTITLTQNCNRVPTAITQIYLYSKLQQEREKEFKLTQLLTLKNDK